MPKLTSEIALQLVTRIEALQEQINAVYRLAGDYDGCGNINLIRDIVKARDSANDERMMAEGMLASLDMEDAES